MSALIPNASRNISGSLRSWVSIIRARFSVVRSPKVGLMSIGEEEAKGTDLTKETARLLKHAPINFIGNVEGRDIYTGEVDVIVSDGFHRQCHSENQ